jgi:peptide-methionine (S)-S-oxide reductase
MTSSQQSGSAPKLETATLGGGCFWCLEAVYVELSGVASVVSGYAGGHIPNPTYRAICTGTTGHAEVVQVTYDPALISYREILEIFFTIHDPTTRNRQGNDVGPQYRSVIFYHDEGQRATAEEVIDELGKSQTWSNPIVTELAPLPEFFQAEEYHQDYYARNSYQPYCTVVIAPKVAKLRKHYFDKLKQRQ